MKDLDFQKDEIKKYFEKVFIDMHEACINDDNDDRIDYSINFLHNMIVLEKQILNEFNEAITKLRNIIKYSEEAENLKLIS